MNNPVLSKHMAKIGSKGGKKGRGKAKARTTEQARKAQLVRWAKKRKVKK